MVCKYNVLRRVFIWEKKGSRGRGTRVMEEERSWYFTPVLWSLLSMGSRPLGECRGNREGEARGTGTDRVLTRYVRPDVRVSDNRELFRLFFPGGSTTR